MTYIDGDFVCTCDSEEFWDAVGCPEHGRRTKEENVDDDYVEVPQPVNVFQLAEPVRAPLTAIDSNGVKKVVGHASTSDGVNFEAEITDEETFNEIFGTALNPADMALGFDGREALIIPDGAPINVFKSTHLKPEDAPKVMPLTIVLGGEKVDIGVAKSEDGINYYAEITEQDMLKALDIDVFDPEWQVQVTINDNFEGEAKLVNLNRPERVKAPSAPSEEYLVPFVNTAENWRAYSNQMVEGSRLLLGAFMTLEGVLNEAFEGIENKQEAAQKTLKIHQHIEEVLRNCAIGMLTCGNAFEEHAKKVDSSNN